MSPPSPDATEHRLAPLKVNKDSHLIHKKSSSLSSSSSSSSSSNSSNSSESFNNKKQQQKRQPVIIYTQSPKIIRTKPCDFMALVQCLTGMPRDENKPDHQQSSNTCHGGGNDKPTPPSMPMPNRDVRRESSDIVNESMDIMKGGDYRSLSPDSVLSGMHVNSPPLSPEVLQQLPSYTDDGFFSGM